MSRFVIMLLVGVFGCVPTVARADIVTDWNATLRAVIKSDGMQPVNKANPGWSTRTMAMLNGSIYDAFQSQTRTHAPFLADQTLPVGASLDAAVHQAAYQVLLSAYTGASEQALIQSAYDSRMALIPDGAGKTNGMSIGSTIAQTYITNRSMDGSTAIVPYMEQNLPGKWTSDPLHAPQTAWGPGWGQVSTWAIGNTQPYLDALPGVPALNSQAYTDAFVQVRDWGALNSPLRDANPDTTAVGLFWAYDRAGLGPPPVIYNRNLSEIAAAVGTSPEENARLFAMASVSMADAAIAAWDGKFQYDFWRPITAIRNAGDGTPGDFDGNADTLGDPNWLYLGAPGATHNDPNDPLMEDDFTPPFPAWPSGHATMGAALYKTLELYFGTNDFAAADALFGIDPVTGQFMLMSDEPGGGGMRSFTQFAHYGLLDVDSYAGSPDGENGISRIFLGIHWIFDQRDGMQLGHTIAADVAASQFQAVPEPSSLALGAIGTLGVGIFALRRRRVCTAKD